MCRTERAKQREYNLPLFFSSYCISTKMEHDISLYVFIEKLAQIPKRLSWQEDEEIKSLGEEWGGMNL